MQKSINSKDQIRKVSLQKRLSLNANKTEELSKKIISKLERLKEFKNAKTILLYHPFQNEVDTLPLLEKELKKKSRKHFGLIRICSKTDRIHVHQVHDLKTLQTGKFDIKEPSTMHPLISKKEIDLAIVPGIAFDKHGNRIGYGKGYFDRLFKKLSTSCTKIALAYDFQIVENIPVEKHDRKVDIILTETQKIIP